VFFLFKETKFVNFFYCCYREDALNFLQTFSFTTVLKVIYKYIFSKKIDTFEADLSGYFIFINFCLSLTFFYNTLVMIREDYGKLY